MPDIEIYTKDYCPHCQLAKSIFAEHGVAFTELSLSDSPDLAEEMVARSSGRTTVPQIFFDGVAIGGADELSLLDERGLLTALLGLRDRTAA